MPTTWQKGQLIRVDQKFMYYVTLTFVTTGTGTTAATHDIPFENIASVQHSIATNAGDIFNVTWVITAGVLTATRTVETAGTLGQATVDFLIIGH